MQFGCCVGTNVDRRWSQLTAGDNELGGSACDDQEQLHQNREGCWQMVDAGTPGINS